MGNDAKMRDDIEAIRQHLDNNHGPFHEAATAGHHFMAAITTTLPPNQRFALIQDNDHLNPDEFDSEVTKADPLWDLTCDANQEQIVRTRERNTYFIGQEAVCGWAFQIRTNVPDGQFLPDGTTLEGGYGGLASGTLTGVPFTDGYDKDGIFLNIQPDTADLRTYKAGSVDQQKANTAWDTDIFNNDTYQYDTSIYGVFRLEFDLYGRGDATLFARLGRKDLTQADTVTCETITAYTDPILEIFDMPVSLRLETGDTPVDWSFGPMHYFNRVEEAVRSRTKTEVIRDPSVDKSFDANGDARGEPTVIAVYRQNPARVEAFNEVVTVSVNSPDADCRVEMREVHRDFLDFGSTNPDDDANWQPPDNQRRRDTAIDKLNVSPGTVTIGTHTDGGRSGIPRGKQDAVAYTEGGGGKQENTGGASEEDITLGELDYLALVGWIVGNADPANVQARFEQGW